MAPPLAERAPATYRMVVACYVAGHVPRPPLGEPPVGLLVLQQIGESNYWYLGPVALALMDEWYAEVMTPPRKTEE